ncbi:MAG: glutamine synthetase [Gammaproteobacteria bacterium]|jgi:glutamine synthetase
MADANRKIEVDSKVVEKLRKEIDDRGIKYLIPSYVDMHCVPKTKIVPIASLENILGGSELFTGAALDGVPQNMSDNEVASVPDPDSFTPVPWRDDSSWFSSDLWHRSGILCL